MEDLTAVELDGMCESGLKRIDDAFFDNTQRFDVLRELRSDLLTMRRILRDGPLSKEEASHQTGHNQTDGPDAA